MQLGSFNSISHVAAIGNLKVGSSLNVMDGVASNPNGDVVSIPVKKINKSITVKTDNSPSSASVKKRYACSLKSFSAAVALYLH